MQVKLDVGVAHRVLRFDKGVVDAHDLDRRVVHHVPEDDPADAAKAVDSNFKGCHLCVKYGINNWNELVVVIYGLLTRLLYEAELIQLTVMSRKSQLICITSKWLDIILT